MIRFRAFHTDFSIPLPILLMPFLAARLGLRGEIGYVLLALFVHESGHLITAKLLRVRIAEIRLMPFGGSARIENPYALPPSRIIPVAAAGPMANLILILLTSSAAQWSLLEISDASAGIRPNLTMMLFNLIPALPLDGGRILFACLSRRKSEADALRVCLLSGRILAGILLAVCLFGGFVRGKWNLTLLLAAVFIVSSGRDERDALVRAHAARLSETLSEPVEARPVRILQISARIPIRRALQYVNPRETAYFVCLRNGSMLGAVGANVLLKALMDGASPDLPVSALIESSAVQNPFDGFRFVSG